MKAPAARFWDKVSVGDGCWEWTGSKSHGYGQFWDGDRPVRAHRWAWEQEHGPVPGGLDLDHLCRNPGCVRPDHLEPVTRQENLLRGVSAQRAKTHCPAGHLYDDENTMLSSSGHRKCRTCNRETAREWHMARRRSW